MTPAASSDTGLAGRTGLARHKRPAAFHGSLVLFGAALMASTALVGMLAQPARAADKVVDGVQQEINDAQSFDDVIVGDTLPDSVLDIVAGGQVDATDDVYAGRNAGSTGTITVSGAESKLDAGDRIFIGYKGSGTLTITDGGEVYADDDVLAGREADSIGTITVSGAESKLSAGDDINIGTQTNGTLTITDGGEAHADGKVVAGFGSGIGAGGVSTGTITVSGAKSKLDAGEDISIGEFGNGTLTITDGGEVYATERVFVGYRGGSTGVITVSGEGSKLTSGDDIRVASGGDGTLNVTDGGVVHTNSGVFVGDQILAGDYEDQTGTITVSGADSKLIADDYISVGVQGFNGYAGNGTLTITDGGEAHAGIDVTVGDRAGSTGTITVSGADSKLSAGNNIVIGKSDSGTLAVAGGGKAYADRNVLAGVNAGSTGTITVSGQDSKLDAGNRIFIGVEGNGTLTITDGGEVYATHNVYAGEYVDSTGTITVSGEGSKLTSRKDIRIGYYGNGTLTITDGGVVDATDDVFAGEYVDSTGTITVSGAGSKLTVGEELYIGHRDEGTLTLSDGGVVEVADALRVAEESGATGTLNIGAASGAAAAAAGTLTGSNGAAANLVFGDGTGTLVFNHTATDHDFNATVSGNGALLHEAGVTSLTGDFSGFGGSGTISGGTLSVDTSFGGTIDVLAGATLKGTGEVGNTDFATGSFFAVDLTAPDHLVTDNLVIGDNVQVQVGADTLAGLRLGEAVTIIEWTPFALTGEFVGLAQDYLFVDIELGQAANTFTVTAARNDTAFVDVAATPNQKAVAPAIDALPNGNAVHDAFAVLNSASEAQHALDLLSGEAHASLQGALIREAGLARDAMLARLDNAPGQQGTVASALDLGDQVRTQTPAAPVGAQVWGQSYGNIARANGDGNAAGQDTLSAGLLTGIETNDLDGFTAGVLAGYGRTNSTVNGVNTQSDIDSFTLGGYVGGSVGALQTRFGVTYALNSVNSRRDVNFGAFSETLTADYFSRTFQAFGEVGYQLGDSTAWFEPFAGLALINVETDGFSETGGTSALQTQASSQTLGITTLGLRGGGILGQLENGTTVSYDANLGWRHAFGEVTPQKTAALASGSQSFTVSGAPMDRDTAVIGAGIKLDFVGSTELTLSYQGEFGHSTQNNNFAVRFAAKF